MLVSIALFIFCIFCIFCIFLYILYMYAPILQVSIAFASPLFEPPPITMSVPTIMYTIGGPPRSVNGAERTCFRTCLRTCLRSVASSSAGWRPQARALQQVPRQLLANIHTFIIMYYEYIYFIYIYIYVYISIYMYINKNK